MNDQELRQMIRDSIARHAAASAPVAPVANVTHYQNVAAAFSKFPTLRSGDDDGACVIEPSVRCNHCGYCLSYGH
jgi:hypothetical protein